MWFSEESYENAIREFNKLIQLHSLTEYQEKFEELHPFVLMKSKGLSESYFVDGFVSGLKDRQTVQMFHPTSVNQAVSLARLQEATLESSSKVVKQLWKGVLPNHLQAHRFISSSLPVHLA